MRLAASIRQIVGQLRRRRRQSAALVYRVDPAGRRRVLLITGRKSKRWGIPKGNAEPSLSLSENAAKEAFEEAGVKGQIGGIAVGTFHTSKRAWLGSTTLEVSVFLLRATKSLDDWPEKRQRRRQWVSCKEAAKVLREPVLVDLCRRLDRGEFDDVASAPGRMT
jgi:8-oxo-dGTP pyrophosphatase MutT (NUDIX family)